jgi:hypothetical protein
MKAMVISFSKALARSAEKQQLLSSISPFFSIRGLNDLVIKVHCPPGTPAVSRFIKISADKDALQCAPGRAVKAKIIGHIEAAQCACWHNFSTQELLSTNPGARQIPH